MSCRKYSAPRHGSLAFVRKRAAQIKQPLKSVPKDNPELDTHLVGFLGYKVGMTHLITISDRSIKPDKRKRPHNEYLEAATIVEVPDMEVFGIAGYGKNDVVVYGENITESLKRRFCNNPHKSKLNAFNSTQHKLCEEKISALKSCDKIKLFMHTLPPKNTETKASHILEVQINGGSIEQKVDYALSKLGNKLPVSEVFKTNELIDIIGVTKGKGFNGCVKRFGVKILNRKSRKGKRKVACIGAWHPAGVMRSVARAGQLGFNRRTMPNKKIFAIGNGQEKTNTKYDLTMKTINPMGGFLKYGNVEGNYLLIRGNISGPAKRVVTLRKSLNRTVKEKNLEDVEIKFVDTSSKRGHGRFQTTEEKKAFYSRA